MRRGTRHRAPSVPVSRIALGASVAYRVADGPERVFVGLTHRSNRAVSSAVEHCFHTAGATGSIPVPPTKSISYEDALALQRFVDSIGASRCYRCYGG